ncbi:linear amide C-N hydrolase [Photobacterium satsumensis]|uniref:linear amide C-N hydrolase n=1 Tax=Photobacterium satsumensis TaxID=2910239 RepID=UPI003D14A8E2
MCSALGLMATENSVLGVNYDFQFDHGMMVINPRKLHKWSELPLGGQFRWHSRYGSATLVQFGCELPCGGINEMGLSIHLLEQRDASYPPLCPMEPALSELQWIQYQLDTCASIDEVLANLTTIKVYSQFIPLHYVIADSSGQGAVIEFVHGEIVVSRFQAGKPLVLTNHSLASSRQHYQQSSLAKPAACSSSSIARYCRLLDYSQTFQDSRKAPEHFVREGLEKVAIAGKCWDPLLQVLFGAGSFRTCWQILFTPGNRTMGFNRYGNGCGFRICLDDWAFDTLQERLCCDLHPSSDRGAKPKMIPYSYHENRQMITKTYRPYKRHFPARAIEEIARYPDQFLVSEQ